MSYHIIITNNKNVTYGQLLKNSFVPNDVCINGKVETDDVIVGRNKFYLENESSRGVVLIASDAVLNVAASTADYMLATKLALAIAHINNATIKPELDKELTSDQFEAKYNVEWAHSSRSYGVDSLKSLLQKSNEFKLPCCIRPYYFGYYVVDKISQDQPNEEQFADRLIDEIKKLQFIDQAIKDLEVPALMEGDLPEGVKTVQMILPGVKLLLQKSDLIILRMGNEILKVDRQQFIQHPSLLLERLDEAQYVLHPIETEIYLEIMKQFSSVETQPTDIKPAEPKRSETEAQTKVAERKWWEFWK